MRHRRMRDLRGRRVFVTGAASGIGRAVAEQAARDGAVLHLTDIQGRAARRGGARSRAPGAASPSPSLPTLRLRGRAGAGRAADRAATARWTSCERRRHLHLGHGRAWSTSTGSAWSTST